MIIVLMGVSSSGKSTIGPILAEHAGGVFADGDDYHPAANKEKMASGHPLDDADRKPWLETLNKLIKSWHDAGTTGVLACSALKQKYRDALIAGLPTGTVHFVLLELSREELAKRIAARKHEFMSPALLDSQIATLEMPQDAVRVTNNQPPEQVVQQILSRLE
jgi:gluconokinase